MHCLFRDIWCTDRRIYVDFAEVAWYPVKFLKDRKKRGGAVFLALLICSTMFEESMNI